LPKSFTRPQNLLDHQIEGPAPHLSGASCPGLLDEAPQAPAIARRILQPVYVIEAEAVELPLGDELPDQAVTALEDLVLFHPDRRELADIEETAVVDAAGRPAPMSEAVMLTREQLLESFACL